MSTLAKQVRDELAREMDGAALLADVYQLLRRFVVYPSEAALIAHSLWIVHCHLMDCWESTPRIAFLSTEPASGKTRALEVTETIVPRPVESINCSAAYLFRKVSDPEGLPTILFDEIDTLFGPKAKENEDVRGILNAGHRRGATAGRCVVKGKTIETEEFPAYCAVAIAGLGNLPDTILTRSIVIRMRRRAPNEHVESYRRRIHAPLGNAIRDSLAIWAKKISALIDLSSPEMPCGIEDRNADVWEALLAVAEVAGGDWPEKAREAAVTLVTLAKESTPSLGIRLLADLRAIFKDADAIPTTTIIEGLCKLDESPWSDLRGRPLDARRLAHYLGQYGVKSRVIRTGDHTYRGYTRDDLYDAFTRYLVPPLPPAESVTSETNVTSADSGAPCESPVSPVSDVTQLNDCRGADEPPPVEECDTWEQGI